MVYYRCSIIKEIIKATDRRTSSQENDVFILVTPDHDSNDVDEDTGYGAIKEVDGVVLPSKKVLGRSKEHLQIQIDDAQRFWEDDGNAGDVPISQLYRYLVRMNMSIYSPGWIVSTDKARELIKNSGGL